MCELNIVAVEQLLTFPKVEQECALAVIILALDQLNAQILVL